MIITKDKEIELRIICKKIEHLYPGSIAEYSHIDENSTLYNYFPVIEVFLLSEDQYIDISRRRSEITKNYFNKYEEGVFLNLWDIDDSNDFDDLLYKIFLERSSDETVYSAVRESYYSQDSTEANFNDVLGIAV